MPRKAVIKACAYAVPQLANAHGPVGTVCTFDHTPYDEVVQNYTDMLYPYALWEYNRKALSQAVDVAVVDYSECTVTTSKCHTVTIEGSGNDVADSIVVWVDWHIDEYAVLSGNPMLTGNSSSNSTINDDEQQQQQQQVLMTYYRKYYYLEYVVQYDYSSIACQ
jgi:hypothetical protein